jgi:hypothetical protein
MVTTQRRSVSMRAGTGSIVASIAVAKPRIGFSIAEVGAWIAGSIGARRGARRSSPERPRGGGHDRRPRLSLEKD